MATGYPVGDFNWSTCDLVSLSTCQLPPLSIALCFRLRHRFAELDHQPHIAAFAVRAGYPLGFIHKRLDEEHSHAARVFFTVHFAIDVWLDRLRLDSPAVVENFHFELVVIGAKHDGD